MDGKALGIIETFGFVAAVAGVDAALKSAEIKLLGCRYIGSGLVSVLFSGDVSSAQVAVDSGSRAANQVGSVRWSTVIARTAEGLDSVVTDAKQEIKPTPQKKEHAGNDRVKQPAKQVEQPGKSPPGFSSQQLYSIPVKKLRELTKQLTGLSLDRRQIRSARKAELIDAIINYYQKQEE